MGVPGLFANLKKKYPKIIKNPVNDGISLNDILEETIVLKPHILFFDFNCIIHPITHILWKSYNYLHIEDFEHKIMVTTMNYVQKLVQYANIQDYAYIFVDGVCPYSKMVQQRQRRLASIIDKHAINEIRHKNGLLDEPFYDTNSITPGTEFMEKFNQYIINFINNWNNNIDNKIKFKYSSYHEPGEGEHKIINYIKENADMLRDKELLIYGLDADLIILSLTLCKQFNIKLLRENNEVSLDQMDMIIFDITECAKSIVYELSNELIYENYLSDENNRYIDDFIFVTTILGNDFIPSNPTVNMKFRNKNEHSVQGYDLLIDMYKKIKQEYPTNFLTLWFNGQFFVDWKLFKLLINELALFEQKYFETVRNRYSNYQNKTGTELEIDMYQCLAFKIDDPLKMYAKYLNYEKDRKKRFIHHYFGSDVCECKDTNGKKYGSQLYNINININDKFYDNKILNINQEKYDEVIKKYLLTMGYIMYYYYYGCPNNLYYYKYCNGILMSDLYNYLDRNMDKLIDIYNIFKPHKPIIRKILPIQQLLIVLPEKSFYLIPTNVTNIFKDEYQHKNTKQIIKYFKENYLRNIDDIKRDYLNKSKLYQATLIIKIPKLHLINTLLANVYVSKDEINRFAQK